MLWCVQKTNIQEELKRFSSVKKEESKMTPYYGEYKTITES